MYYRIPVIEKSSHLNDSGWFAIALTNAIVLLCISSSKMCATLKPVYGPKELFTES